MTRVFYFNKLFLLLFLVPTVQQVLCDLSSEEAGGNECNLGNQKIRIAVIQQAPLVSCLQNLYGDWKCNGSNIEIINIFEKRFNFSTEWVVLTESQTQQDSDGRPDSTAGRNNFVGLLNLVQSGRAWMSANGLMRTIDRERDLMLSEPFDNFRLHFLLSKTLHDHDHIFLKPFDINTWIAFLFSSAIIVPIFYLINRTSYHYLIEHNRILRRISNRTCLQFIWRKFWSSYNDARPASSASSSNQVAVVGVSQATNCHSMRFSRRKASDSSSASSMSTSFCDKVDELLELGAKFQLDPAETVSNFERRRRHRLGRHRLRLELRRVRQARRHSSQSGFSSIAYVTWYVVSSLASQGGETEDLPRASSTRILVAFWWFYLIVIVSIHPGVLTAVLTFPKQNDFIQTLEDFLELSDSYRMGMKVSVDQFSEVAHLLAKPENSIRSRVHQLFNSGYNHLELVEGHTDFQRSHLNTERQIMFVDFKRHRETILAEIQQGRLAHIEEKSAIDMTITREFFDHKPPKCLFKTSRFPIDVIPMSFLFSNRLPKGCIDTMNLLLVNIMEMGLASKWRRKYEVPSNDCLNTVMVNAGDIKKIDLPQVALAFWILIAGLAFGLASLVFEIIWMITADSTEHRSSQAENIPGSFLTDSSDELGSDSSPSSDLSWTDGDGFRLGHHNSRKPDLVNGRHPIKTLRLGMSHRRDVNRALMPPRDVMTAIERGDPSELMKFHHRSRFHEARRRLGTNRLSLIEKTIIGGVNKQTKKQETLSTLGAGAIRKAGNLVKRLREGRLYSGTFIGPVTNDLASI